MTTRNDEFVVRPPSKYDAVYALLDTPHPAYLYRPGDRFDLPGGGKGRVVAIAGPRTVHYQLIAPWWHRLYRFMSQ